MLQIYRRFGLEFEFGRKMNREKLAKVISSVHPNDKILVVPWQKNTNNEEWICKTDSSCGYEVCTPVFNSMLDLIRLEKVLKAFTEKKVHITKSCGVHLHLESKDFTVYQMKKLLTAWIDFESVIYSMFPVHRRMNRFCLPLSAFIKKDKYSPTTLLRTVSKHKNRALNARGYCTRGTIEFRLMEGTVDTVDVLNWIMFCQQFVERSLVEKAADISKKETALELIDFLESKDQGLISWILGRIKRFA